MSPVADMPVEEVKVVNVPPCKGTLGERICAIQAEIGNVEATGQNFAKGQAISIEDVARAIRPLKAKHGVVVRFRVANATDLGGGKNWRVDLVAHVENASDPTQYFEEEWCETGMNLSAAYSYGRKSYQKMLFDIATKEDDDDTKQRSTVPPPRGTPRRPPQVNSDPDSDVDLSAWSLGNECPVEGCDGRIGGSRTKPQCSRGHIPGGMAPEADGL